MVVGPHGYPCLGVLINVSTSGNKKIQFQVHASNNIFFFAIKLSGVFIIIVEMSDQNFVDEDIKGEKASSSLSSKKMKTLKTDASGSDQVIFKFESPFHLNSSSQHNCRIVVSV
jgi:hypothetical protein